MKDPALRACSIAARGLWMDMLCLMFESDRRGFLQAPTGKPYSHEQLARMTGCLPDEVSRLLAELETSGVYSRTAHGVIFSRRIKRDEENRAENRSRQNNYRNSNKTIRNSNADVTPDVTRLSHPSSSSSSSSIKSSSPVAFQLPAIGGSAFDVTEEHLAKWRGLYLAVDVEAEVRKMIGWLDSQPAKRKTIRGTPAFVSRWLGRAQDQGGSPANLQRSPGRTQAKLQILAHPGGAA